MRAAELRALDREQKERWRFTPFSLLCIVLLLLVLWQIGSRILAVKCPEHSHPVVVDYLGCRAIAEKYVVSLDDLKWAVGECSIGRTICVPKTGVIRPVHKVVPSVPAED
jgi:hypothetical protein